MDSDSECPVTSNPSIFYKSWCLYEAPTWAVVMLTTIILTLTVSIAYFKCNSTSLLRTCGVVMFMSLYGIAMPDQGEDVNTWGWFTWAKRISLFAAYCCFYLLNTFRGGKTTASRYAGTMTQIVLLANVAEAAVLGCTQNDWFLGLCLFAICLGTPLLYVTEDDGVFLTKSPSWFPAFPPDWYFNLHYILLGVMYTTTKYFETLSVTLAYTCFVPLLCSLLVPRYYRIHMFLIRAMLLVLYAFLDSFLFADTYSSFNINEWYHVPFVYTDFDVMQNDLTRNLIHILLVGCLTGITYAWTHGDKNEGDDGDGGDWGGWSDDDDDDDDDRV